MKAIIFANGEYCPSENQIQFQKPTLVIAADGGGQHCQSLKIIPDVLIGDLDSMEHEIAFLF